MFTLNIYENIQYNTIWDYFNISFTYEVKVFGNIPSKNLAFEKEMFYEKISSLFFHKTILSIQVTFKLYFFKHD